MKTLLQIALFMTLSCNSFHLNPRMEGVRALSKKNVDIFYEEAKFSDGVIDISCDKLTVTYVSNEKTKANDVFLGIKEILGENKIILKKGSLIATAQRIEYSYVDGKIELLGNVEIKDSGAVKKSNKVTLFRDSNCIVIGRNEEVRLAQ